MNIERRIDYKTLLILVIGISTIYTIVILLPRELVTFIFYYILIPTITITSILKLKSRK